jgi:gamma-glutamylcyclotransferase
VLYFAYGSNLDWAQMKARCPSARFVGLAKLADYRLAFTRRSINRGCGVADAVPATGRAVWGVVFEISELEIPELDRSEGFRPGRARNSYWRRECAVLVDGDHARPLTVTTYLAEPEPDPPLPNQHYKGLIVAGARRWRLPADYIAELESIEVAS